MPLNRSLSNVTNSFDDQTEDVRNKATNKTEKGETKARNQHVGPVCKVRSKGRVI